MAETVSGVTHEVPLRRSEGAGGICVACVRATEEQQAANGAGTGAPQPGAGSEPGPFAS